MYSIVKYKLNNGEEFDSKSEATKKLDNMYGDVLCRIAREISNLDFKYVNILHYLDDNLESLSELVDLRQELNQGLLVNHDEEDY